VVIDFCQWPSAVLLPEPTRTQSIFEIQSLFAAIRLSAELEILTIEEEVFVIVADDELFATGLQGFPIPSDCFLKFFSAIEAMFQSRIAPRLHEMLHTAIVWFGG
jgi:hypothetical protein